MIKAIYLLVATAWMASLVTANVNQETYQKLCKGENVTLELTNQVKELASMSGDCPRHTEIALAKLADVVSDLDGESVCDMSKVVKIYQFYYFSKSSYSYPAALNRAFLAYALRLSNTCRNDMIELVISQLKKVLPEDDFASVSKWTGEEGPIAKLFALAEDDGLRLPSSMVKVLKAQGRNIRNLFYVQVSPEASLAKTQAICDRRFKPVYSQITDPLLSLSFMGFNYEAAHDDSEDDRLVARQVSEWYRVVFMCWVLDNVEIIEDESMPAGQMKFLMGNEGYMEAAKHEPVDRTYPDVKQIKFNEQLDGGISSGDSPLVDPNDPGLLSAIENFQVSSLELPESSGDSDLANFLQQYTTHVSPNVAPMAPSTDTLRLPLVTLNYVFGLAYNP